MQLIPPILPTLPILLSLPILHIPSKTPELLLNKRYFNNATITKAVNVIYKRLVKAFEERTKLLCDSEESNNYKLIRLIVEIFKYYHY